MKQKNFLAALLFATAVFTSCDKDDDNNNDTSPNAQDRTFMTNAAYGNRAEIDFGQLALTKSTNDTVRAFAQLMITDHTNAQASLDSLGDRYNVDLPTTLDSAHAAMRPVLMALDGYSFDTTYMNSQVKDHQATINLFQTEVNNGRNPDVKNYAAKNLPHLQHHLHLADSIRNEIE